MSGLEPVRLKDGGFPDLTGDGKVTRADILKGRGVEGFAEGGDALAAAGLPDRPALRERVWRPAGWPLCALDVNVPFCCCCDHALAHKGQWPNAAFGWPWRWLRAWGA